MSILVKMHTGSNKGKTITKNPHIALAIHNPQSTYSQKYGVSLRGVIERIFNEKEMARAVGIYSKAFPGSEKRFASTEELISKDAKSTLFRIKITSGKMLTPEGYSAEFQYFN